MESQFLIDLSKRYRIPCGPMKIRADGVCRRNLKDSLDTLLDRLTEEINPYPSRPASLPQGVQVDDNGRTFSSAELQGNSKLLQDISSKIEKR